METIKPLAGKGILTPIQKSFLSLFSRLPDSNQFYLTGGTALSEYYFSHRLSFDLDFFAGVDDLVLPASYEIEQLGTKANLGIKIIRRFATYVELLVTDDQDNLKVDLALDSPYRFEPAVISEDGILVNDLRDLQVDKLLAYFGRAEPRDAVDLYFILQHEQKSILLEQATQKDPGFDPYWFTIALNRSLDFPDELSRWPVKMLVPFEPQKAKNLLLDWSREIMQQLDHQ